MKIEAVATLKHKGKHLPPGETVDLPDEEARSLVERGMARDPRPARDRSEGEGEANPKESTGSSDPSGKGAEGGSAKKGEANQKVG